MLYGVADAIIYPNKNIASEKILSKNLFSGKRIFGSNFSGNQPVSLFTVSRYLGVIIIHQSGFALPEITNKLV